MHQKNIYWISTVILFSLLILTGILYFIFYGILASYFTKYGYPIYLIYPLAIAKIIGSVIILHNKNRFLIDLAYAGFFYNFILAFFAHILIGEFDPFPSISMVLLVTSYISGKNIRPK